MRQHRKYLLLLALVLVMVGMVVAFIPSNDPAYRGKRLSEWLAGHWQVPGGIWLVTNGPNVFRVGMSGRLSVPNEVRDALHHIGTNALPYLLRSIEYDPPSWKTNLLILANRFPRCSFQDHRAFRAERAALALPLLGPQAKVAIPTLALLMNDQRAPNTALRASTVLSELGSTVFEADLALMTNHSPEMRREGIFKAGSYFPTRISTLVPSLVQVLEDTNYWVAVEAARVLSAAQSDSSVVVPALTKSLADRRVGVRIAAIQGLWEFHAEARPAVPALQTLLNDSDPRISKLAADALEIINRRAPEKVAAP